MTDEALQTVLKRLDNPNERKRFHSDAFKSALIGLRSGRMTYEGDVVLPMLIEEISKRIDPLTSLTKDEESRLFALSKEQKRALIDSDNRAKIQYLTKVPEVSSAAVKNSDSYKHIIARMKGRVESTFKI